MTRDIARHRLLDIKKFRRDRPQRGVAVEPIDQRAQGAEVGILLVGVQRHLIVVRQRRQLSADAGQPFRIMNRIAVELELEIAGTRVFADIGNTALALDRVVHADGMPDRDPLQPLSRREELRDIVVTEIARQPCIDAADIGRHAVEEIRTSGTQQRVKNSLVDLGRAIGRRQRRNILVGAGLDLRPDAGCVQGEGGLIAGMRQIKFARDQQRASQFGNRLFRRKMRPLVEPFRHQKFGTGAGGVAFAFDVDLDTHEHLRRRVDDNSAEPERPGKADRAFEERDISHSQAIRHRASFQSSGLWVKKCLRIRCTSSVKAGSAIESSERGRGSGTS